MLPNSLRLPLLLCLAAPQRPRVWGIQDDLHLRQKGSLLRTLDDRAETSIIMANQVPQKRARGQAESPGEQRAEHWGLFLDLALNGSPRQCFRSTSLREKHSHPSLNIEPQGSRWGWGASTGSAEAHRQLSSTHVETQHTLPRGTLHSYLTLSWGRLSSQNALRQSVRNFQSYEGAKYNRLSTLLLNSETRCVHIQGDSLGTLVSELLCLARPFGH